MQTYQGSCLCGAVRFEIATDLTRSIACNCSICSKKGALHHRVPSGQFKLLAGEDALTLYQFGTHTAKHWFCRHCGIYPFSNPRIAPEQYSINIRCLDDCDLESMAAQMNKFGGRNWEEAIKSLW